MEYDKTAWAEIAKSLSEKLSYQDLGLGLSSKEKYIDKYLPELRDGRRREILDIGAGIGAFCHVCQELGHRAVANLPAHGKGKKSYKGYRDACKFFGVEVLDFTFGDMPSPVSDDSFDVVNSQAMLGQNDFRQWVSILDDMVRICKRGGVILLSMNHESGTEHEQDIDAWANRAGVEILQRWREAVTWKFIK